MSSQESKSRSGRFDLPANELVEKFNATIPFEQRVCPFDIKDSQTHAAMLARQGIISEADAQAICRGLDQVAEEIRSGKFVFTVKDEDIHMAIEKRMTEIVGPAGGRLHTGRSRNDQTTTSTKMYLRHVIREVQEAIRGLQAECVAVARANADVIMPGFTHMQTGQPILFAHWMMAFFWMLERDFTRFGDLYKRMGRCPLGSAALAGTDFPIDRDFTAKALGFDGPTENSIDSVSDRDHMVEFNAAAAMCYMHLSRLCEELVTFSSQEFKFIELSDDFCTGSSIMPQKKNPDIAELTRGKSGRLIGDLTGLLATLKGLPTAYARDLQEDKEAVFDQVDTLEVLLPAFTGMVATMVFDKERLEAEAPTGFALATDIAEWLVKNGVPFRHAHELSGACVKIAEDRGQELWDLTDEEFINVFKDFLPADKAPQVREVLSTEGSVSARNGKGGTSPLRVREQIVSAKTTIEQLRAFANSVSDGSAYKSPESLLK